MRILASILWFLIFTKSLLFWLWLWQLKEYHFGRFRAHFETQKIKKIISSFYRIKFPELTKKTIIILFFGILIEFLILIYLFSLPEYLFYISLLILVIISPLFFSLLILLFQIPTVFLRKIILKRAKEKRKKFKELLVIGITGSYGKTSTKEFLGEILSEKFNGSINSPQDGSMGSPQRVLKTKKHINAEIGIAQTILNELQDEHQIFIAEIGAYERGKIKEVCEILRPKIGILTGISEQHLSTFGSQENIIGAKYELIESLPPKGLAVFNGNNKYCQELYQRTKIPKRISAGKNLDKSIKPDIWAQNIKEEKEGISFKVFSKDGDWADFRVNLIGAHNIENILMAAIVAKELGINLIDVSRACDKLTSSSGTLRLRRGKNEWNILDATYSANSQGVISHLDYLKIWPGKKIIIMPCLIELGSSSKEVHQRIGEKIGKICDLAIVTTGDRFKELKESAQKSGMSPENILLLENPKQIFEKLKKFCLPGDIILLESRVPQLLIEMLVGKNGNQRN